MTTIAILGSGRVGSALATKLASAGHDVVIGSRTPDVKTAVWEGPAVRFADVAAAVADADIVINASPGESSVERLGALKDALAGKVLVDVANATKRGEDNAPGSLLYPGSSLAEQLQEALPSTRVVKTLNSMLFMVMGNPGALAGAPTAFLSGDDDTAKATVRDLLGDLGWAEEQILDLGDVRTARGPEALILLVPDVIRARGFAPFAITVVS